MVSTFTPLPSSFYQAASPFLVLSVCALLILLSGVTKLAKNSCCIFVLTNIAFGATLLGVCCLSLPGRYLQDALVVTPLSIFLQLLLLGFAWLLAILTYFSHLRGDFFRSELVALYLFVLLGMMVFSSSEDLVSLFVGLEISSIGLYTLVGYTRVTRFSLEGGIKYLVLGSFATALLLFGFAFLYAVTGSLQLPVMMAAIASGQPSLWLTLGASFTIFALGFKLALVPFQQWSPDAYEGAATNITAFMTICVKIMVLSLLIKILGWVSESLGGTWVYVLGLMSVASMLFGNIMALIQSSIKRMLAYSSIAHSGYMAIALGVMEPGNSFPARALLFYLLSYALTSLLVFGIILSLEHRQGEAIQLNDLKGLAKRYPWLACGLTVGMLSFAGLPPTAGFLGKFFVFNAAVQEGHFGLVLCAVVASVISLFYYLHLVVMMYMHAPGKFVVENPNWISLVPRGILAGAGIGVLALGTILPGLVLALLQGLFG